MGAEQLAVRLFLQAQQYKAEARQAATATSQIGTQAQMAGTATSGLQKNMGALGTTAKFAVAGIAAGAVAKFGKDSVTAFLGFDDAMNQSLAIMGDVSEEMRGEMAAAAREVGKSTRIGAEEAAEAYFFLASAGLDAEQAIGAMPQVAAFAQAGMFDMATATDLATDAQSALGLSSDDAAQNLENLTRVTDVFVRANTLANTSVQQISEAMTNKAGAAMRAVGIDIEEGAAVLAAFADQGVKGAEAGTQFSIVLRDLQTKALENKSAFEKAGISVFDANGEFRNFADVIGDLENRLGGMSDAQKKAELATLGFSDKSIAALTTLLGTSDAIGEYESELRNAAGTTQDVADKQLESFQGQLDLLKGRVEDAQIAIGEGLVPALLDLADSAVPVLEVLGGVVGLLSDLKGGFDALPDSDIPILSGIGTALGAMLNPLSTFKGLWEDVFGDAAESVEETAEAVADFSPELERARANVHDFSPELERARGASEDYAEAVDEAGEETEDFEGEVYDAAAALKEANSKLSSAISLTGQYFDLLDGRMDAVRRLRDAQNEAAEAQEAVNEALKDHGPESDEYLEALEDQSLALQDVRAAEQSLVAQGGLTRWEFIQQQLQLGLNYDAAVLLADELDDLFKPRTVHNQIINTITNQTSGGSSTVLQPKAMGGPVSAGQPYIVGEEGPELFVPGQSGTIIPNQTTTSGGAMGGGNTIIHLGTVYGWDDFVSKVRDAGVEIART